MNFFTDKIIIITGASSGIGYELAKLTAMENSKIVLIARREDLLAKLKKEILSSGNIKEENIQLVSGDISDPLTSKKAVELAVSKFGKLDVVINNAGVSMNSMFEETDLEVFKQMMDVNYFGSLYLTKYSLPYIIKNTGSIFFISSIVGKRGFPTRSGYSAAKFAVHGLFESLLVEMKEKGVYVGILAPGYTDTEIRKKAISNTNKNTNKEEVTKGDVMSAEDAARKILNSIAKKKRETILTFGGKIMVWLNKNFPKLADKIAAKTIG